MKRKLTLFLALFFVGIGFVMAQTQVRGTVVDEKGEPIIGANIRLKSNPQQGAATNINGEFTLSAPANDKLVVSFVGYLTQEVAVKSTLKIVMKPDTELLDEVLVVAFGKAKKSAFTGSAVQVSAEEISKRQVSNVTQALAGKAPGINVSSGNNQPGTTANVQIRGVGSFSAGTGPLYVVDGVPYDGDISAINQQDIESLSILKDAASAALYGARGANGVILIQTKSGSRNKEKIEVTFDARYGFNSRAIPDYDVLRDPGEYASKYFEGIYNYFMKKEGAQSKDAINNAYKIYFSQNPRVANLVYHPFTIPDGQQLFVEQNGAFSLNPAVTIGRMLKGEDGKEYWLQPDNWSDEVFQANPRQEYNLSVSGAGEKANYYMSAGFLDDKGYIVGSGFRRFTARLRSDFTPTKWLKLGANIGFTQYTSNSLNNTTNGGDSGNIFAVTSYIAPIYPLYVRGGDKQIMIDKFGNTVYDFGTKEYPGLTRPYLSISNPMSLYHLDKNEANANIISAKGYIDFNLLKGLKLTMNVGFDSDNTYFLSKKNVYYGQFAGYGGIAQRSANRTAAINLQQLATYNTAIDNHHIDVLLGHEFYKRAFNEVWGEKQNMYHPDNTEVSGAILKPNTSSSMREYATEGFLGRILYDYDNRYFFSASFRHDATSRFTKKNRWGNFWSIGGSWLINQESFMEDNTFFNLLKLKASFGMQGNDAIGDFRYADLYILRNSNDQLAVSFYSKGNENITWETSKNLNVGIEYGILKNRITGSIELYSREVTDMLFSRKVPTSAGYSSYFDNIGSMRNNGFDFEITGQLIKNRDLTWLLSINGGHYKNTLTKLPPEWEELEDGYRDGSRVYRVGGSIHDRAYPHYLGVNEKGLPKWQTYDKKKSEYGETTNYDEATDKVNRKIYTDMAPVLTGGISTSLDYKGFDVSVSLSYGLGGRIYDAQYAQLMHGGAGGNNAGKNWHKDILNSWRPDNTGTDIPMVDYSGKWANANSDRFLISRSYLGINNITLGYSVPKNFISKLDLTSLRVYFVADNLALFSARKGLDPRFNYAVGYQAIRTVSGGIRLSF